MKESFFSKILSKKLRLERLKFRIMAYLAGLDKADMTEEKQDVLDFLKTHHLAVFPYYFPKRYKAKEIEIFKDPQLKLHYMLWEGKKLYYKDGRSVKKAQKYFNSLRLEQDLKSPHRYLTDQFNVNDGDVVVDVGAAEGNFSLSVIERAGAVYLFESEKVWIKALEATFAPWKDKVTIVNKYVSDYTSREIVALDTYFNNNGRVDFIKADVEGHEASVLRGANTLIHNQNHLKVAVCTYHNQEDGDLLVSIAENLGFKHSFSEGYMIFHYGRENVVKPPYLRRGVLRAVKQK